MWEQSPCRKANVKLDELTWVHVYGYGFLFPRRKTPHVIFSLAIQLYVSVQIVLVSLHKTRLLAVTTHMCELAELCVRPNCHTHVYITQLYL